MMTTSLMASQVSIVPAKAETSRRMRSRCSRSTSSSGSPSSQSGCTVCQTSG
jgi:hypothetical protein